MASTDELSPTMLAAIHAEVFQVLRSQAQGGGPSPTVQHYSTNRQLGPFSVDQLFSSVMQNLVRNSVISNTASGQHSFPNYGWPGNVADIVRQTIWQMYQQGIIVPSPSTRGHSVSLSFHLDLNYYLFTSRGLDVLSSTGDQIQVYHPEGYLAMFQASNPLPDVEMMRYLTECVQVFRDHHLLATVVLLGAASERLVEVFAEYLRDALGTTAQGDVWFKDYSNKRTIIQKFDTVEKKLMQHFGKLVYDRDIGNIKLVFETIRTIRNDIVHQHNYQPTWNEVNGLLHNFVLYFKNVSRVINVLLANPL